MTSDSFQETPNIPRSSPWLKQGSYHPTGSMSFTGTVTTKPLLEKPKNYTVHSWNPLQEVIWRCLSGKIVFQEVFGVWIHVLTEFSWFSLWFNFTLQTNKERSVWTFGLFFSYWDFAWSLCQVLALMPLMLM